MAKHIISTLSTGILSLVGVVAVVSGIYNLLIFLLVPLFISYILCVISFIVVCYPIISHHVNTIETINNSTFDPLTGLYNRTSITKRINELIEKKHRFHLYLIDLCKFKEVNDTYGHHIGDRVLEIVATRLTDSIRSTDIVCRLGGDEFVVVVRDTAETIHTQVIDHITSAIKAPILVDDHILNVDFSLGGSMYPDNGQNVTTLMTQADCAMYNAKKNNINIFLCTPGDHACALKMANKL